MNEPLSTNEKPKVAKWLWITLIVVAVLAAGFFAWFYLMGPGKKEAKTTTTNTSEATTDLKTYTNKDYEFSFKYPTSYNLIDLTTDVPADVSSSKVNLYVDVQKVSEAKTADGVCGSSSKALYETQKEAFDNAQNQASFDTQWQTTNPGIKYAKIMTNKQEIKFAYGQDLCWGDVAENENVTYQYKALTFLGDNRITLSTSIPESMASGTHKEVEANSQKIAESTFEGDPQIVYNELGDILDSFDTIVSTAEVSSSDTSDWLTFSGEGYGFTFKYPKTWEISSKSNEPINGNPAVSRKEVKITDENNNVYELDNPVLETGFETCSPSNEKEVSTSSSVKFNRSYGPCEDQTNLYLATYNDPNNIDAASVSFFGFSKTLADSQIQTLDKILSTFTFVQ